MSTQPGSSALTDNEFVLALQDCSYPIADFRHLDHLRLGWILLSRMDPAVASDEAARIIRQFSLRHGKGHAYHETITRAWMHLLATHDESSFDEFRAKHAGRLAAGLLHEFWRSETLGSPRARIEWVPPDVKSLPMLNSRLD
jgi:hypothetical protein